jgi:hypothetical protein
MSPHIDVKFVRMPHDPSVEASAHRWVDRIRWTNVEIERADITIERSGWRRIAVRLTLVLAGRRMLTAAVSHTDVYVAVADAFRDARKQALGHASAAAALRPLAYAG